MIPLYRWFYSNATFWLISLYLTVSSSIYISSGGPFRFFLWLSGNSLDIRRCIFFVRSSVSGHLGCFHILALVASAALSTEVHPSFWIAILSRYMPGNGIAGSCGGSVFSFPRNPHTVLHSGCSNLHFHELCWRGPFSQNPLQHLFFVNLLIMAILTGWDVPHCSYDLHFANH